MKLRINYPAVMRQANLLSEDSSQFSKQIQKTYELEQECRKIWKGDAADEFIRKISILRQEMIMTNKQMNNLVGTIKDCANDINNEDKKLAMLLKNKK